MELIRQIKGVCSKQRGISPRRAVEVKVSQPLQLHSAVSSHLKEVAGRIPIDSLVYGFILQAITSYGEAFTIKSTSNAETIASIPPLGCIGCFPIGCRILDSAAPRYSDGAFTMEYLRQKTPEAAS